jgi:hypothetical protein
MYKKRKELAKELSRSESPSPSPDPVEQGSAENQDLQHRAEVTEVYKLPPFKKQRKTPLGIPYLPIQIGYREKVVSASLERVGFSYPDYDRGKKKKKKTRLFYNTT